MVFLLVSNLATLQCWHFVQNVTCFISPYYISNIYMWPGERKGPLRVNYSQWHTRHVLLHILGNIDCKRHYTHHQDSFFVFRCYTESTETFINLIYNTTASAIPLITVFANSLHQAYSFRNKKPATSATIILHLKSFKLVRLLRKEKWE